MIASRRSKSQSRDLGRWRGTVLTLLGEALSFNDVLLPVVYAFSLVGFLIALKRPGNAIAWVCLGIGGVWGLEYAMWGLYFHASVGGGPVAGAETLVAIGSFMWIPGIFGLAFVLMLFPDGRLRSARWRWLPWLAGISIGLAYLITLFSEPLTDSYGRPNVNNPLSGVLGPSLEDGGLLVDLLELVVFPGLFVTVAGSIVVLVRRYRRSKDIERHQLKWLATAGSTSVALFVAGIFLEVASLARRLGTTVDIDAVTDELIAVVARTMQPETTNLWIRDDGH